MSPSSWIVSQIGGREHYAIARGLARRHLLALLVTDFWRPSWLPAELATAVPWRPFQRWAGRFADGLDGKVAHFNLASGVASAWNYGRRPPDQAYVGHIDHGRWFARKTARLIERHPSANVFFGYCTASLEALVVAKARGMFTIVDQIDPALEHYRLVEAERNRFPGWEEHPLQIPEAYWRRLRSEWEVADLVVVNSEWSRQGLIKQGVPEHKLAVIPLAYEAPPAPPRARVSNSPPGALQVLWLGTVTLGKGIPYLIQAAREVPGVQFHVAGPMHISSQAVRDAPPNVRFHGQVPHVKTPDLYAAADVFLLPTISDGFAITQLEAMARGVPVIATPNCGQVVVDGHNGFVVPPRDPQSIAARLAALDADRGRLDSLSANALATVGTFTLDKTMDSLLTEVGRRRSA